MITVQTHRQRRHQLMNRVDGPILLMGNGNRSRNLPMNALPFRQDSTFLYFTGCHTPNTAALLVDGHSTLFVHPPADDDALWHGHTPSLDEIQRQHGFEAIRPIAELENACQALGPISTIAVADVTVNNRAEKLTGMPLGFGTQNGTHELIEAVISMRRSLCEEELEEIRKTALVTDAAHRAAMAVTHVGGHEREVASVFNAVIAAHGLTTAYQSIVTIHGEVLHNHHYTNTLEAGQLLLLDGGAEAKSGYATDVTRTWPVTGTFTPRQRAVYDAVLASQEAGIAMVVNGTRYRDIHTQCSLVVSQFLFDEGLIKALPEDAVESGAHALFFPHGVGHLLGLDVHDLENFGDRAAYPKGRKRSPQFGTGYLRLDLDLEPGMVVTIEPGIYFVPAILKSTELYERFKDQVDFDRAHEWLGFGGVRIEDDVAVTKGTPDVLTGIIPKTVSEMTEAMTTPFIWESFTPR